MPNEQGLCLSSNIAHLAHVSEHARDNEKWDMNYSEEKSADLETKLCVEKTSSCTEEPRSPTIQDSAKKDNLKRDSTSTPNLANQTGGRKQGSRTPSGSTILTPVSDIRKFYSPVGSKKEKFTNADQDESHDNHVNNSQSSLTSRSLTREPLREEKCPKSECVSANQSTVTKQTTPNSCSNQVVPTKKTSNQRSNAVQSKKRRQSSENSENCELLTANSLLYKQGLESTIPKELQLPSPQSPRSRHQKNQKRYKADMSDEEDMQTDASISALLNEHGITESVTSIDVRTVLTMFHKLSADLTFCKTNNETSIKAHVEQEVNVAFKNQEEKIEKLEREVEDLRKKAKLYEGAMQYNHQIIDDLAHRLDAVEFNNTKRSAVLTGLKTSKKKEEYRPKTLQFLQEKLQTEITIDDIYKLGSNDDSPIVLVFPTLAEKERVFQLKSKLKNTGKNEKSKEIYYINHFLPATENARRKRHRQIVSDNKRQEGINKVETEFVKGGLKVGSTTYKRKINPPNPTDLLNYSVRELDDILKVPTVKGPEVRKKDSVFTAYSICTDRIQQVRDAYFKIRLLHPAARHIICAYNLPCAPKEQHLFKDACDDGEAGAGANLLHHMKHSNIHTLAYFVVRYCGEEKLGETRFDCYLRAAKALQAQKPVNTITQQIQQFKEKDVAATKGASSKTYADAVSPNK